MTNHTGREAVTPEPNRQPDGYAYRYPDPFGGIRFNDGREVNGRKPIEALPYWFSEPNITRALEVLRDDCAVLLAENKRLCNELNRRSDSEGAAPSSKPDPGIDVIESRKRVIEFARNQMMTEGNFEKVAMYAWEQGFKVRAAAPSAPVVQASLTDEEIFARAEALVRDADAAGKVVTIELHHRQPPAMGNYEMVADVRPAREKAKPREVCNNCDTALPEGCGGIFKGDAECRFAGPEVGKE